MVIRDVGYFPSKFDRPLFEVDPLLSNERKVLGSLCVKVDSPSSRSHHKHVGFGSNVGQIGPKWDKSWTF